MNFKTNLKKGPRMAWSLYSLSIKSAILSAFILTGIQVTINAQDTAQYTRPSWWFGVAGGANINFYRGSTQELNSAFIAPAIFHGGTGVGAYVAPLIEFHKPDSRWGAMLRLIFGFTSQAKMESGYRSG